MNNKNEEILVSVICLCYNHEKYIKDALEGFVNQKTSFKYEVIIHDDASTDNSAKIIREYEKKYPDIIKPIYQTINQHSRGVKFVKEYILPNIRGKYIAFCEGDDYWTNENKLEKQVVFLENNPQFCACVHNTERENVLVNKLETMYGYEDKELTVEDILKNGRLAYHTSSLLIKKSFYLAKPEWTRMVKGVGDFPTTIYYILSGRVMYFGDVMSHYRLGVPGSWTQRTGSNIEKQIKTNQEIIKMLQTASEYYNHKYDKNFSKIINVYKRSIFKSYVKYYFPWVVKVKKSFIKRSI